MVYNPFSSAFGSTSEIPEENQTQNPTVQCPSIAVGISEGTSFGSAIVRAKLHLGVRMEFTIFISFFVTIGVLLANTLLPIFFSSPRGAVLDFPSALLSSMPQDKVFRTEVPSFKIWSSMPSSNGFPFYDRQALENFWKKDKSEPGSPKEIRSIADIATTKSPEYPAMATSPAPSVPVVSITTAAEKQSVEIDFVSFGCNILDQYWVCSKPRGNFCVFFDDFVPAIKKLRVIPIVVPHKPSSRSGESLMDFKCRGKIQVMYRPQNI